MKQQQWRTLAASLAGDLDPVQACPVVLETTWFDHARHSERVGGVDGNRRQERERTRTDGVACSRAMLMSAL
jgi:hypothetical protein